MTVLKTAGLDYLADIAGIDYLHYPDATDRYGVVYALANTETSERVYIKVFVNDPQPHVASVYSIWKGADWMEREVFDMFGIVFDGHPDLRRLLMPEDWEGHPARKDYPVQIHKSAQTYEPLEVSENEFRANIERDRVKRAH